MPSALVSEQQHRERERDERDVRPRHVPAHDREHDEQHQPCRKKCTSMLPTAARAGSRGGTTTFFTSPALRDDRTGRARRGRSRRGSRRAGPRAARSGRRGSPTQDDRERDVEDDEVQQRVQQRPREPEDAVLVLDLELVADHPDEQLAALDDPRRVARGQSCGAGRSSLRPRRAALEWAAPTWPLRYPAEQPQPGSDRAVIRRSLGQDLAAEALDATAHEHVIDLTVRAARRDRCGPAPGAPSRASPRRRAGPRS